MKLASIRIITKDVKRLVQFYVQTIGPAKWLTEEFAEVATPGGTLAIGSERTMTLFGAGAARGGENHSVIVEFRVDDVDREFARLAPVLHDVVQAPVTQPWGNRSLLFRDPDGNLVNFFAPVTAEARARFGGE